MQEITYNDDRRYKLAESIEQLEQSMRETLASLRVATAEADRTARQIDAARSILVEWAETIEQDQKAG